MKKTILLVMVGSRSKSAVEVQKILTEMGCFVKTRLGIHDGSPEECTNTGLIILDIVGADEEKKDIVVKLRQVPEVRVEMVEMSL